MKNAIHKAKIYKFQVRFALGIGWFDKEQVRLRAVRPW